MFGRERPEWLGPLDSKNILKICLLALTECTNVTDRWTLHDGIVHACIALHGKCGGLVGLCCNLALHLLQQNFIHLNKDTVPGHSVPTEMYSVQNAQNGVLTSTFHSNNDVYIEPQLSANRIINRGI